MSFQLESYAPFCSMAVRKSFLTVDQQLATAPGPSHYTPDLEDHVKGGDSLKSKVCALHNTPSTYSPHSTYNLLVQIQVTLPTVHCM